MICNNNSVLGYNLVNGRLMSVWLKGHPVNITSIPIDALTSAVEEDNVEEFYGKLQDLVKQIPKGEVFIIIGDWNVKIGEAGAPGIAGQHRVGFQN